MAVSLFRQNALNHLQQRLHGDVLLLPKTSAALLTNGILLWVIACLIWLALGNYARKETVQGWLEPPSGLAKIVAQRSGIVEQVFTSDGADVKKGDTLMIIGAERQLGNGDSVEQTLLTHYQQQLDDTRSQKKQLEAIYSARHGALNNDVSVAKNDILQLEEQRNTLQQRMALVHVRLNRLQNMQSMGHISQNDIDSLEEQRLGLLADIQRLAREKLERSNRVSQLSAEQLILPQTHQQQMTQLALQASELQQQMTQVSGQREYTITAPKDGVISNLRVRLGQAISGSQLLMTILPSNAHLQAQLLVPLRAAGFLFAGQSVDIRYDAFPYQKFGLYRGTLEHISTTVVLPNELINAPLAFNEPVYLVSAKLDSATISAFGEDVRLKSDMTFSADIEISERSLLEWLIEPILSLQGTL